MKPESEDNFDILNDSEDEEWELAFTHVTQTKMPMPTARNKSSAILDRQKSIDRQNPPGAHLLFNTRTFTKMPIRPLKNTRL